MTHWCMQKLYLALHLDTRALLRPSTSGVKKTERRLRITFVALPPLPARTSSSCHGVIITPYPSTNSTCAQLKYIMIMLANCMFKKWAVNPPLHFRNPLRINRSKGQTTDWTVCTSQQLLTTNFRSTLRPIEFIRTLGDWIEGITLRMDHVKILK